MAVEIHSQLIENEFIPKLNSCIKDLDDAYGYSLSIDYPTDCWYQSEINGLQNTVEGLSIRAQNINLDIARILKDFENNDLAASFMFIGNRSVFDGYSPLSTFQSMNERMLKTAMSKKRTHEGIDVPTFKDDAFIIDCDDLIEELKKCKLETTPGKHEQPNWEFVSGAPFQLTEEAKEQLRNIGYDDSAIGTFSYYDIQHFNMTGETNIDLSPYSLNGVSEPEGPMYPIGDDVGYAGCYKDSVGRIWRKIPDVEYEVEDISMFDLLSESEYEKCKDIKVDNYNLTELLVSFGFYENNESAQNDMKYLSEASTKMLYYLLTQDQSKKQMSLNVSSANNFYYSQCFNEIIDGKITELECAKKTYKNMILTDYYNSLMENDDFDKYKDFPRLTKETLGDFEEEVYTAAGSYYNDPDILIYSYLYNSGHKEEAKEYYETLLKDKIRSAKGMSQFIDRLESYGVHDLKYIGEDGVSHYYPLNFTDDGVYTVVGTNEDGTPIYGKKIVIDSSVANNIKAAGDGFGEGLEEFIGGIKNFFGADGEIKADDYEKMYFAQVLSQSGVIEHFYNTGKGVGNAIIPVVLSSIPVIGNAASMSLTGAGLSGVAATVVGGGARIVSAGSMFLSVSGNKRQQMLQSGANEWQAWFGSLLMGAVSTASEFSFGGLSALTSMGTSQSIRLLEGMTGGQIPVKFFKSLVVNGLKEIGQEELENVFEKVVVDGMISGEEISFSWDEIKNTAIASFFTSIILNGITGVEIEIDGEEYKCKVSDLFKYNGDKIVNGTLNAQDIKAVSEMAAELDGLGVNALMRIATMKDYDTKWSKADLSSRIHAIFDGAFSETEINSLFNDIVQVSDAEWKNFALSKTGQENIVGFVQNGKLYLPEKANTHTAMHEIFHKLSNIYNKGKVVTDIYGNQHIVTGITQYYSDGFNTVIANETLTEYLSSKYDDGVLYESRYFKERTQVWERIDNVFQRISSDPKTDTLLASYLKNDLTDIEALFTRFCSEGTYYDFARALDTCDMNKVEKMLSSIEKNTKSRFVTQLKVTVKYPSEIEIYQPTSSQDATNYFVQHLDSFAKKGIDYFQYMADNNFAVVEVNSEEELALVFGDDKLYGLTLIDKHINNPLTPAEETYFRNLKDKYRSTRSGNLNAVEMLNAMQSFLTPDEINNFQTLINSGTAAQESYNFTWQQKAAIYNYTNCGGFEFNSWFNDGMVFRGTKKAREAFSNLANIQDRISGQQGNRVYSSWDGSIITDLDSMIANTNYSSPVVTYRGTKDIYIQGQKIDVNSLHVGDVMDSDGYQSSSLLFDRNYGATHSDHNIILKVVVPPNSGTARYIENDSGIPRYNQTEMLIKRSATMQVIEEPYKQIINGVEKTIVPVIIVN